MGKWCKKVNKYIMVIFLMLSILFALGFSEKATVGVNHIHFKRGVAIQRKSFSFSGGCEDITMARVNKFIVENNIQVVTITGDMGLYFRSRYGELSQRTVSLWYYK